MGYREAETLVTVLTERFCWTMHALRETPRGVQKAAQRLADTRLNTVCENIVGDMVEAGFPSRPGGKVYAELFKSFREYVTQGVRARVRA